MALFLVLFLFCFSLVLFVLIELLLAGRSSRDRLASQCIVYQLICAGELMLPPILYDSVVECCDIIKSDGPTVVSFFFLSLYFGFHFLSYVHFSSITRCNRAGQMR